MNMKILVAAAALSASVPAFAITVNVTGFTFGSADTVAFGDDATGVGYTGWAGSFQGTLTDSTNPPSASGFASPFATRGPSSASFTAYCAEITQSFFFGQDYEYTLTSGSQYFSGQKATDLSRLFTATGAAGFVSDSSTSAAMQAAIWEIIYEQGTQYSLNGGNVVIQPQDASTRRAFATVNGYLANLSRYDAAYNISLLTNPSAQDFLVATIPEPGTWALMVGGLGLLALSARRGRR